MSKSIYLKLLLICLLLTTAIHCVGVINHNENEAAARATEFARTAFVEHNIEKAYSLLTANTQTTFPIEKFRDIIQKMHPQGFPAVVTATEFEMRPGQNAINIFLIGDNGTEKFYYRLEMEGTAATGYKIFGFYRGNGSYPPSPMKKSLPTHKFTSILDLNRRHDPLYSTQREATSMPATNS